MSNYYGQPITPPEYFDGLHIPNVPAVAGLPPVCSCGWTRHDGYEMADHLRDMHPFTLAGKASARRMVEKMT